MWLKIHPIFPISRLFSSEFLRSPPYCFSLPFTLLLFTLFTFLIEVHLRIPTACPGCDIPFFECLLFLSHFSEKQAISMSGFVSKSATFFEISKVFCLFFLSRSSENQNFIHLFQPNLRGKKSCNSPVEKWCRLDTWLKRKNRSLTRP